MLVIHNEEEMVSPLKLLSMRFADYLKKTRSLCMDRMLTDTLTFALFNRPVGGPCLLGNSVWVGHLTAVDESSDGCVVIEPNHITYETNR